MSEIETLGILDEIQALVSDNLQVVSYKWLSRNFLVSSNSAKRLLQDFVQNHGSALQVVYSLSGWLKNNPSVYHIKLVSAPKLEDAKQEFDGNCSVQVYSVQACIPKDPAALWNAEYVQAEELFKQPSSVNNCLRDNRFCGISSSFVTRNAEGTSTSLVAPQPKNAVVSMPFKNNNTGLPPQPTKVQQLTPKVGLPSSSPSVVTDIKTEKGHEQAGKPPTTDKERVNQLPANNKKKGGGQSDKSSSGTGSSLANMWGRASAKSKSGALPEKTSSAAVSAEAQIVASEASETVAGNGDNDGEDVNFKKVSNGGEGGRKRRVIFDYSDEEEEEAVSLASPDFPKEPKESNRASIPTTRKLNSSKKQKENSPKIKEEEEEEEEEKVTATESTNKQSKGGGASVVSKEKSSGIISPPSDNKKIQSHNKPEIDLPATNHHKANDTAAAQNSPKRRKVLKTRIDERGREVTEVVWEGEEAKETKSDTNTTTATAKKTDSSGGSALNSSSIDRAPPPLTKKSPSVGNSAPATTGKGGNKKGGNVKDPKQGNIMSFFKKKA